VDAVNKAADLAGRIAIVTGGGTGVGAATARLLAARGAHVVIAGRTLESLERTADIVRDDGGSVEAMVVDVREEAQVAAFVAAVIAKHGRVDILVNNAGGTRPSPIEATSLDGWRKVAALNVDAAFLCLREVGRHMLAQGGGAIVNVSSLAATRPTALTAPYSAAKAGLESLTRTAALEWGGRGIRVNCVALGFIATERARWHEPQYAAAFKAAVPLGRAGHAAEVAEAIAFLVGDGASYISGQTIEVAGGLASPELVVAALARPGEA
jgi:3-oxoacyl-[acyl-carrier protein] reductase